MHATAQTLKTPEQVTDILSGVKVNYHDWTGEELAIYVQIPRSNEKLRQVAIDYLVDAIKSAATVIQNNKCGISKRRIEEAIKKLIEEELDWVKKRSCTTTKNLFEADQNLARIRIQGMVWLADCLLGGESGLEALVKDAWERINRIPYWVA